MPAKKSGKSSSTGKNRSRKDEYWSDTRIARRLKGFPSGYSQPLSAALGILQFDFLEDRSRKKGWKQARFEKLTQALKVCQETEGMFNGLLRDLLESNLQLRYNLPLDTEGEPCLENLRREVVAVRHTARMAVQVLKRECGLHSC